MCQLREEHNTDLQRYSLLNELLSSNQVLFYKVCGWQRWVGERVGGSRVKCCSQ